MFAVISIHLRKLPKKKAEFFFIVALLVCIAISSCVTSHGLTKNNRTPSSGSTKSKTSADVPTSSKENAARQSKKSLKQEPRSNSGQGKLTSDEIIRRYEAPPPATEAFLESWQAQNQEAEATLTSIESETRGVLELVAGLKGAGSGEPPRPTSDLLKEIRKARVELKLAPVEGATFLLQLKDSAAIELTTMSRKLAGKAPSAAEQNAMNRLAQAMNATVPLATQVSLISSSSYSVYANAFTARLTSLASASYISNRPGPKTLTEIRKNFALLKRMDASIGELMAITGALQASVKGRDPEVVTRLARKLLQSKPSLPSVSEKEVRAILAVLRGQPEIHKKAVESELRRILTDRGYEATFKSAVDHVFDLAIQNASSSASSPPEGGASNEPDTVLASHPQLAKSKREALINSFISVANSDPLGAMDEALGTLSPYSPLRIAAEGTQALMDGDFKKAIKSALALIPGGSTFQDAFDVVSSLI